MIRKYPSEVCTGFIGVKKTVIDNLDLDNAPSGMEFSSWFLINTIGKKKDVISVERNGELLL